ARAKNFLGLSAGQDMTEDQCKVVVTSYIREGAREFRALFWDKARGLCHFGEAAGGRHVLVSYGRGTDHVVEAVLTDAERPLHYSEIAERVSRRIGRSVDLRRVHNAAAAVGILLGRGSYGLEKHIGVTPEQVEVIREEV